MEHEYAARAQLQEICCAEVVYSTLSQWQAVSNDIYAYPGFGSLLIIPVGTETIIGMVCEVVIAPCDDLYVPIPLGLPREELARMHPQSSLHTRVMLTGITLGYEQKKADGSAYIYYQWPTRPAYLHALVYEADDAWYTRFFVEEQYISMLMHNHVVGSFRDELLLACVAQRAQRNLLHEGALQQFVSAITPFFMPDYNRFRQFLQRVERLVAFSIA